MASLHPLPIQNTSGKDNLARQDGEALLFACVSGETLVSSSHPPTRKLTAIIGLAELTKDPLATGRFRPQHSSFRPRDRLAKRRGRERSRSPGCREARPPPQLLHFAAEPASRAKHSTGDEGLRRAPWISTDGHTSGHALKRGAAL
jgi:hypothetical protein